MKSTRSEMTQRYLLLFKLDAKNVFDRIKNRRSEYMEVFALRRTREHFPEIFSNKYEKATLKDLSHCSTETLTVMEQFYTLIDEMKWYLYQTEDMPNTVEDTIIRKVTRLQKLYQHLTLYLDAELGLSENESIASDDDQDVGTFEESGVFDLANDQKNEFTSKIGNDETTE